MGGFPHKSISAATRGEPEETSSDYELEVAAGKLIASVGNGRTVDELHVVAVAHLLTGRHDESIRAFHSALRHEHEGAGNVPKLVERSQNPALLNDMAVAYLSRHRAQQNAVDLRVALNVGERSFQIKKTTEAAWNRALALEEMHLGGADPWNEYLRLDATSAWAGEARQRIASRTERTMHSWERTKVLLERRPSPAVVERAVASFPLQTRVFVEDELLARWAMEMQADETERVQSTLNLAGLIGRVLADGHGDDGILDTLHMVEVASTQSSPRLTEVARGCEAFARARAAYLGGDGGRAATQFAEARQLIGDQTVSLSLRAQIYQAGLEFQKRRFAAAARLARSARQVASLRRYPTITAQAYWVEGLIATTQRDYSGAMTAYGAARALFERVGDHASVATVDMLVAENQRLAGDGDGAWRTLLGALRNAGAIDSHERIYVLMSEAGKTAELTGDDYAALAVYERAGAYAREHSLSVAVADVSAARAEVAHKLHFDDLARNALRAAEDAVEAIADGAVRARVMRDLSVTKGIVLSRSEPAAAVEVLRGAVDAFRREQNQTKSIKALLALARAERALGRNGEAERTLVSSLDELDRQRARIGDAPERLLLMQNARPIVDELVRLRWNDGRKDAALAASERARDTGREPRSGADNLLRIELLPSSVTHVVYHVLPEKLLVWVIAAGEVRALESAMSSELLELSVAALDDAVDARSDIACRRALEVLEAAVVEPFGVPLAHEIVFLPDGPLVRVPYAALRSQRTGQYLAKAAATRVAISLASLMVPPADSAPTQPRFLLVAPREGGPRLSETDRELESIRRAFARVTMRTERELTREQFLAEAPRSSHLHFAGHASSAPRENGYGRLILGEGPEGILSADDIAALDLRHTELVTLAACESAAGNATSEGSLTLTRAFLAAGARSVVGTLWAVEDDSASAFSRVMYRELAAGRNLTDAVRHTQLELLAQPPFQSPLQWAAFQLSGHGGALTISMEGR